MSSVIKHCSEKVTFKISFTNYETEGIKKEIQMKYQNIVIRFAELLTQDQSTVLNY